MKICSRIGKTLFYLSQTTYPNIVEMLRDHGVIWTVHRSLRALSFCANLLKRGEGVSED